MTSTELRTDTKATKPDYGWDAPYVTRNLLIGGVVCLAAAIFLPSHLHFGKVDFLPKPMLYGTGALCLIEVLLFWHYVKRGKFLHRDFLLNLYTWTGNEQVLDVGCGRGLLLVGAAKRLTTGRATGIDIWSTEDMGGNSEAATLANLEREHVRERCSLVSEGAQQMSFADASFDVIVSNVCLHNMDEKATRQQAVAEIARVLRPGGAAMLSDYKLTEEYAEQLRGLGWQVERRWGSLTACFPPMRVVIARKPSTLR